MILTLLFHAFYSSLLAFVLAGLFGSLAPWMSAVALLVGLVAGRASSRKLNELHPQLAFSRFHRAEGGVIEIVLAFFVLYASARHFLWILFPMDHGISTLNKFNFGDLPLHVNYIRAIAQGVPFPPVNPSFATEPLRYPFGPDLYNALWESLGVPMTAHLFVTGIVSAIASVALLRAYAGWWGIGAFFLSGGLAGLSILFQGAPMNEFHDGVDWKNLFLSVFVTQRGMLFALPAGLLLLIATQKHFSGEKPLTRGTQTALGVVWGTFPLFHAHGFVIVSLMMGAHALIESGGWRGVKELLLSRMALFAYVPAIYFVLRTANGLQRASVAHLDWFWTTDAAHAGPFFLQNFGAWLLLPIAIATLLGLRRKRFSVQKRKNLALELTVYIGFLLLFLNLMLAPWAWDNIKLLIWPYLGLARLAFVVIEPEFDSGFGPYLRPIVAAALFFSGFLAIVTSMQSPQKRGVRLYSTAELALTQGALEKVPPQALIIAAPTHEHPLTWFGRLRIVGYEGHLWSHGIDYRSTLERNDLILKGDKAWLDHARSLNATHIFWGPAERAKYGEGPREWMQTLVNVSRVPGYEIYVIR